MEVRAFVLTSQIPSPARIFTPHLSDDESLNLFNALRIFLIPQVLVFVNRYRVNWYDASINSIVVRYHTSTIPIIYQVLCFVKGVKYGSVSLGISGIHELSTDPIVGVDYLGKLPRISQNPRLAF